MKNTLLTLLLMPLFCYSQLKITGNVTSEDKKNIESAEVNLFSQDSVFIKKVLTDVNGAFIVESPEGIFNIEISYAGSVFFNKKIQLDQDINLGTIVRSTSIPISSATEKGVTPIESIEGPYSIDANSSYSYNNSPSYNNNINIVYSRNKWKVNSSLSFGKTNEFWDTDVSTFYPDLSFIGVRRSYLETVTFLSFIDIEYQISDKTKINVFTRNDWDEFTMIVDDQISIFDNQNILNRKHIGERIYAQTNNKNAVNFLLKHDFNKKNHFFTIEADWFQRSGTGTPIIKGQDYNVDGTAIANRSYDTFNNNALVIDTYSLNGLINIPLKWFDFAIKGKWLFTESDYDIKNYRKNNFDYEQILALSPMCKYIENRQALFLDLKKTIDKWDFNIGIKFENTLVKGNVSDVASKNISNNFNNLLPSIRTKYSFNEGNEISFSYKKALNRPLFRTINPATAIYNAYENYTGNPFINLSISDDLTLSYNSKSKYDISFSYSKIKNSSGALTNFSTDNIMGHTLLNYLNLNTYQLTVNKNLKYFDFMETDVQLQGFYKFNESLVSVINNNSIWGWYGMLNNQFYLNKIKTISTDLNFWYLSKTIENEYSYENRYVLNFGMKFLLLKQNLTVNLNVTDALRSLNEYAESTIDNINQKFRNYWEPRSFKISATYKFGNKKLNYRGRVAENIADHRR